jgi:hypothetical protein
MLAKLISVAKGPPPSWSRRDCRFDNLVVAAIGKGYGHVLRLTGIESLERAHDVRRGIYRCAKHRGVTADAGPGSHLVSGDEMGVHATGKTFELRFRVWSKRDARKRHLQRYGADRSAWPYDPRRPKTQDDIDSWAAQGLNEKGHRTK